MHTYHILQFIRYICYSIAFFCMLCSYAYSQSITTYAPTASNYITIPTQSTQSAVLYSLEALPNPLGKITDMYLLDSKVDMLFTPLSKIHYSFLSGGMWLRFSTLGESIIGRHLFLNLGSYVAFPISVYRSTVINSQVTFEKLGTYVTSRINLQSADIKQDAIYTYYISLPTIPSPLFSPIIENGNSTIADLVSIIQIIAFSILLLSIIFSLLRAILQKKYIFLTSPLFSLCILFSILFGVPNTAHGFIALSSFGTSLSAIFAVVIFPLFALFALVKNGDTLPRLQRRIVFAITFAVFCISIIPLLPTMAFVSRYYPFWPVLLLLSFPIALYTLQKGYNNSLLYLIACITPTISLGLTAVFSFLYIDSFFYTEVLPLVGLTISSCCVSLFKLPFTFVQEHTYKKQEHLHTPEEITPYWIQSTDSERSEEEPQEQALEYETPTSNEEDYDITTTVKERVVQAMSREPNIIPYSPRELFVYLYRALKKFSEQYDVELSWFVDPDLDENQEHDSDVIYNTLYSIGESLIINNPHSSVHISAKKITDNALPSHIRFSITITPENTLHNFNSNSIADIAELIALAGGTLFMGNAQGKKMEMIITLPALAKLINSAITPKEHVCIEEASQQNEGLQEVIEQSLEEYELLENTNPLLSDLEQAMTAVLPPTTESTRIEEQPQEDSNFEEAQEQEASEDSIGVVDTQPTEPVYPVLQVVPSAPVLHQEESEALEDLRNELARLTNSKPLEAPVTESLLQNPLGVVSVLGESESIYEEEIEEAITYVPPITKMPLPKTTRVLQEENSSPKPPQAIVTSKNHEVEEKVNEYLEHLDATLEEEHMPIDELSSEDEPLHSGDTKDTISQEELNQDIDTTTIEHDIIREEEVVFEASYENESIQIESSLSEEQEQHIEETASPTEFQSETDSDIKKNTIDNAPLLQEESQNPSLTEEKNREQGDVQVTSSEPLIYTEPRELSHKEYIHTSPDSHYQQHSVAIAYENPFEAVAGYADTIPGFHRSLYGKDVNKEALSINKEEATITPYMESVASFIATPPLPTESHEVIQKTSIEENSIPAESLQESELHPANISLTDVKGNSQEEVVTTTMTPETPSYRDYELNTYDEQEHRKKPSPIHMQAPVQEHSTTSYNDSIDISHFIDDPLPTTQEESVPLLLTNDMALPSTSSIEQKSIVSMNQEALDATSFTASIRSSVQELLDARTEAEWEEIVPVFSDRSSIIILDSNPNNRRLLLYFLEGLDYTIADVDTTQSLLKQHAHYPAHLVVIDKDSIEDSITDVVTELHKIDRRYGESPVMVVALVSNTNSDIMNSGVVAVLPKPVNHTEFRGLLLKLLPERIIETGRTAPQWAVEDDIAPMDFNKVTITPITTDAPVSDKTVYEPMVNPTPVSVSVQTPSENINNTSFLYNNSTTVTQKKVLLSAQEEVYTLPEYLYPRIPDFLSHLQQHMNAAETALRMKDYYKIIDVAHKIAEESRDFSLPSMEKVASCIERAAMESDESAVTLLFEELANTMDVAVSSLVKIYENKE